MNFQLISLNGARWQLIEINGVLFADLKFWVRQKRHRPRHDKTSGLSFGTALCPHEYKKLTRKFQMSKQNEQTERNKKIKSAP
jgi:hypothetical protein